MEKKKPFVIGIEGFSGSGKTTLTEKLIPYFKSKGYMIAVIKHDAHGFDMDREGKDTFRFTAAGADLVMISSETRSTLLSGSPRSLDEMTDDACDMNAGIILVEGYKNTDIPKLFLLTKRCGYNIPAGIKGLMGVVTDDRRKAEDSVLSFCAGTTDIRIFDIDDAAGIAAWVEERMKHDRCVFEKDTDKAVEESSEFSHFDDEGNARMVDVSDKDVTLRTAVAAGRVLVNRDTFELIKKGGVKKGDVLTVAQIAGIMGAKRTPELIPMCHPVITDGTDVRLKLNEKECCIDIESEVKCTGRTGVEMEAICACSVAAMTVYDMCKSVQRDMVISDIRLVNKTGGVHGDYIGS